MQLRALARRCARGGRSPDALADDANIQRHRVKPTIPLLAVSFFAADVQAGAGPFLGIYLLAHGWRPDTIGAVLTVGAIVAMLVTAPAGWLIDTTRRRRAVAVAASALTIVAAAIICASHGFWPITSAQIATAIAGAVMGPAIMGLTLGIAGRKNFARQYGRNQVANHAGNVAAAAFSGLAGWRFGISYVFVLSALFGVACVASVLLIPARAVHRHYARGLAQEDDNDPSQVHAESVRVLVRSRPLLLLAITLAVFSLGNSAMLPLYCLAIAASHHGVESQMTAATLIISQLVMLVAAAYACRVIHTWGFWWVIFATLAMLPLRALTAAWLTTPWGVVPVQVFDGLSAGLQSVAVPALVVHLLHGSGRVNLGQGALQTVEAVGGCLSPLLGGWVVSRFGFSVGFVVLGSLAVVSLAIWTLHRSTIRGACDTRAGELERMTDIDTSALFQR